MLAKAIFAVAAAVMVGLAAFAPPEAAAKGDRPMMSDNVGTSVGRIKLEPQPRIRNKALEQAVRCKLDMHQSSSHYCGKW
jgi:hypothetical protein